MPRSMIISSFAGVASFILLTFFIAAAFAETDDELRAIYSRRDWSRMRQIAESGDARAQAWMGLIVRQQERPAEAKQWFARAAEQGGLFAMESLAQMLFIEHDDVEAAKWVRRAAEAGDAHSQGWYGALLATGRGVNKDEQEAVRWYIEALSRGNRSVALDLAQAYDEGRGVPRDAAEAYALATVAESNTPSSDTNWRQRASQLRARLSAELSTDRMDQAARRTREILRGSSSQRVQ